MIFPPDVRASFNSFFILYQNGRKVNATKKKIKAQNSKNKAQTIIQSKLWTKKPISSERILSAVLILEF
jgi:hypothetical protein